MSIYRLVLFVHVISDITLFIGIGAQLLLLIALRRANDMNQVRMVIGFIPVTDRMGVGGSLLTIASGFYMALTAWGLQTSWIIIALAGILLIIGPLIGGIVEPRTRALVKMAKEGESDPVPAALEARIHDPVLGLALHVNLAVVIGIVYLMTTKPSLAGSIMAMIVVLALGVASGLSLWGVIPQRSNRNRQRPH